MDRACAFGHKFVDQIASEKAGSARHQIAHISSPARDYQPSRFFSGARSRERGRPPTVLMLRALGVGKPDEAQKLDKNNAHTKPHSQQEEQSEEKKKVVK